MKMIKGKVDLVVAGGGRAGHTAAIQVAQMGIKVSAIDPNGLLGGMMTNGGNPYSMLFLQHNGTSGNRDSLGTI